jgi:hypothetical protein
MNGTDALEAERMVADSDISLNAFAEHYPRSNQAVNSIRKSPFRSRVPTIMRRKAHQQRASPELLRPRPNRTMPQH